MNNNKMNNDNFDNLSWHDNKVYSISFPDKEYNIKLDIDFIIEWIKEEDCNSFKFLVAPTILKFKNVSDLSIKIDFADFAEMYIDEIKRKNKRISPNGKIFLWDYSILLDRGEITFTSTGYCQEFSANPKQSEGQIYDRENS